jgi:DNA (cytosine-5)-methyltransferase 1
VLHVTGGLTSPAALCDRRGHMTAQPRVVSLFCGAGGMDLGFVRAGFEVVWANDAWADACATYRRNLGDHVCCRDVRSVDAATLPPCEMVIGGPPCQGYSVGGRMDPATRAVP